VAALAPSPRAGEAVEETAPEAGTGAPAARQLARKATRTAEAPARAVETAGGNDVRRAPDEEEKGIFYPEVSGHFPSSAFSDWPWPKFLVLVFAVRHPPCPLLRRPRC
jgi:hypothetical protein